MNKDLLIACENYAKEKGWKDAVYVTSMFTISSHPYSLFRRHLLEHTTNYTYSTSAYGWYVYPDRNEYNIPPETMIFENQDAAAVAVAAWMGQKEKYVSVIKEIKYHRLLEDNFIDLLAKRAIKLE